MKNSNQKSLEDTSLFWERLASDFKKTDAEACGGTEHLFENWVKFRRSELILDAGCGYGRFTIPLANQCGRVVAIDLSLSMLRRLNNNVRMFCLTNVDMIQADLRFLPFRSDCFDGVICWSTLYYIPKPYWRSIIADFSRILHEDGELLVQFKRMHAMLRTRYLFGLLYIVSYVAVNLRAKIGFIAKLVQKFALLGRVEYFTFKRSLASLLANFFSLIRINTNGSYFECWCSNPVRSL